MVRRIRELLAARQGALVILATRATIGRGTRNGADPEFCVKNHTIRLEVSGMTPHSASG
jgi:hypothetical protein